MSVPIFRCGSRTGGQSGGRSTRRRWRRRNGGRRRSRASSPRVRTAAATRKPMVAAAAAAVAAAPAAKPPRRGCEGSWSSSTGIENRRGLRDDGGDPGTRGDAKKGKRGMQEEKDKAWLGGGAY